MDSPFWTQYSPPCVLLLRLAVNHRINHLRLLPLAPANPFCPGLHRRCSYCQPRVKWTLFRVLGGWEVGFVHNKADLGSKLSLCCGFFCWHTWKKNQLGFCKPLLPSPGYSYHIRHVQSWREREFVVNRCWSKPKCHTDTDFRAPSGQEVLSQARSCIHKLTLELATAGEGRWRAQFSLGWFEVAHPLPALLSTLFLEGKLESVFIRWWCWSWWSSPSLYASLPGQVGISTLGKKGGGISSFRLNLSLKCYLRRVRTSLFWALFLQICLV